jgi:hypothetical protein
MLSTHQLPGRLRRTHNLIPRVQGGVASRPSMIQALDGEISAAAPWGNRALMVRNGRIVLWDGVTTTDFGQSGLTLSATSFQALTLSAQREDRLYVADGVTPLWYLVYSAGSYARRDVVNTVLDANGAPYALPIFRVLATWQARLWGADGSNRIQHCQADKPEEWDPLWTQEFQGHSPDRVYDMLAADQVLYVGLRKAVFAVSGTSHLNFERDPVRSGVGVGGPRALASDGGRLFIGGPDGLFDAATEAALSEDIREMWESGPIPVEMAIDRRRRLLLILANGRLIVMRLDRPGLFGEIIANNVVGLIATDDYTGYYGRDGLWFFGPRDYPDVAVNGVRAPFESVAETWEEIPNTNGDGRAVLARTYARLTGSQRGAVTYTATVDRAETSMTQPLADYAVPAFGDQLAGLSGEPWPARPVLREFPVGLPGGQFIHTMGADCHLEIEEFRPEYQFGARDE